MATDTAEQIAAHTPGPWVVRDFGRFPGIDAANGASIVVYGEDGEEWAGVRGTEPNEAAEEVAANARLIAAAPDLLEALQKIAAGDFNCAGHQRFMAAQGLAAAAIAKAVSQ